MEQINRSTEKRRSPAEAKIILIDGNKRFVTGALSCKDFSLNKRIDLSIDGQNPIAAVLTCSDSRVSPEFVFDQGLGDIFVIRNAGNIADIITLGSIEYAVENLGVSLIIILAHEKCGAVKATIDGKKVSSNLKSIINTIAPSLKKVQLAHKDKS
ncbi:MAG TPA: carbonic anhydrase, partial [Clostridium sp.]